MIAALPPDNLYFAPDWRRSDTFRIRTPEQVARLQHQRAIMLANPDIVGKLIDMIEPGFTQNRALYDVENDALKPA